MTADTSTNRRSALTLGVIAAVAVSLALLGSVPMASGSVWASLDRRADRLPGLGWTRPAGSVPGWRGVGLRAARRGAVVTVLGAAAALFALLVLGIVRLVKMLSSRLTTSLVDNPWGALAGLAAAVVVFAVLSHVLARRLQVLARCTEGSFTFNPLADARALASGWAVVYAAGFGLLTVLLAQVGSWLGGADPRNDTGGSSWTVFHSTVWAAAIATVVLLGLSLSMPLLAIRQARKSELARADQVPLPDDPTPADKRLRDLVEGLINRRTAYRRWVEVPAGARPESLPRPPGLTPAGDRLGQAIHLRQLCAALRELVYAEDRVAALHQWRGHADSELRPAETRAVDRLARWLAADPPPTRRQATAEIDRVVRRLRGRRWRRTKAPRTPAPANPSATGNRVGRGNPPSPRDSEPSPMATDTAGPAGSSPRTAHPQ